VKRLAGKARTHAIWVMALALSSASCASDASGASTAPGPAFAGDAATPDVSSSAAAASGSAAVLPATVSAAGTTSVAAAGHPDEAAGSHAGTGAAGHAAEGGAGAPAAAGVGGAGAGGAAAGSGGANAAAADTTCDRPGSADASTPAIYIVGDSTASVYDKSLYPRTGWAQPLQDYFAPACASVHDEARSGRSSKSFYDEGAWTPVRNALRNGDYVLIQFGHNDEKTDDAARYTEPFRGYQQYLQKYIDESRAKGAVPLLLTPIERNQWKNGAIADSHGDYPKAMRELANNSQTGLVDMTALTKSYLERIGQAQATKLFMNLAAGESPNYPDGNSDNTHLQETGARIIAEIALADLWRVQSPIARLLRARPMMP
jgi:lysophospholipase L1-like esterase